MKALPYVILSGKGEAFEVEGSDLYLTNLFQKNINNYYPKNNHPYIIPPRLYPFDSNDSAFGFVISAQGDCLPLGCHCRDTSTPGVGKPQPFAQGDCLPLGCHCRDTSTLGDCIHLVLPLQKITMITHAIRLHLKTNVVSLSRCDGTCSPRGVADWLEQSADSIKNKTINPTNLTNL